MASATTATETAAAETAARGRAFIRAWKPEGWRLEAGAAADALATHGQGGKRLRDWCQEEMLYNFDGGKERADKLAGVGGSSYSIATASSGLEQRMADEQNLLARIARMEAAFQEFANYAETRGRLIWLTQQGAEAKAEVEAVRHADRGLAKEAAAPFIAALQAKAREVMQPPGTLYGEQPPSEKLQRQYAAKVARARATEAITFEDVEPFFRVEEAASE